MDKVIYKELSYKITGLLFKTHKELGIYRNEKQYGDYFEKLLENERIIYKREYRFEDKQYGKEKIRCICDFVIDDKIIKEDYFQLKRYLNTLNLHLGILINFRQNRLSPKRVLNSNYLKK